MSILVKNINGTANRIPPVGYSSWLDFWEKKTGLKATKCNNVACSTTKDLVGAHVIKVNSVDQKWYIVPLCKACNAKTDSFYVAGPLVPVN
jgi:hypothetical protein